MEIPHDCLAHYREVVSLNEFWNRLEDGISQCTHNKLKTIALRMHSNRRILVIRVTIEIEPFL